MQIWVDADACPNIIKEILFRAAERAKILVTLVANQQIKIPRSPHIKTVQVESGFDVADNFIAKQIQSGELLITADIPLAAEAMDKGAQVLNPRGELYSIQTIRQRLVMRDLMDELRGSGIQTGGQPAMSQRERQAFANHLDSYLARLKRQTAN